MSPPYTDLQLDALRELANIGSGTAGTALSTMLGRPVVLSVPRALALPLAEAVEAAGPAERQTTAVVLPIAGGFDGVVLLLLGAEDAETVCGLLGVDAGSEWGDSALQEVGNILGSSYMQAMGAMTGIELEPAPPQVGTDMLGAIVASVVTSRLEGAWDTVLLLDCDLAVEGESCSMSFLLVPAAGGVGLLLERLGL